MFKKIGLRPKMLLALALGISLLFSLTFFVARTSLLQGYSQLEDEKVKIQIDAAINLLSEQAYQLDFTARDTAHSDDLHQFAVKPNSAYIKANWDDNAQINLKVNAVLIVDNQGEVLHQRGLDYTTGKPWPIPSLLMQAISKGGALVNPAKTSTSGLFWTPEGVLLISAFEILDSNNTGPRHGTLVLARLIDQDLLDHIEIILDAKLALKAMPDNEISAISPELEYGEIVKPLSNNQVAGYTLIQPIGGEKKLVLSIIGDRKIFKLTESSLKFLYGAVALAALLLGVFSWVFDKLVLKKLAHLNESVIRIGQSATTTSRINALSGNDEMNSLAQGINSMLARLDDSQNALQFEKERAQVTLAGIADAVIATDNKGHVTYMNTAAERLSGLLCKDISGKSLQSTFKLMAEDESKLVDSAWLTDLASPLDEVMFEREDGQKFVLTKSASPLYDEDMHLFSTVTVLHDVTMLRKLSKQISYQARHDQLTGLVNRYEFEHKLQEAIDDSTTEGSTHCLAYFDLDRFKIVNDTCGHNAGDLLLRQLSSQLKQKVRSTDTLARLGGDEFGLLLNGCNIDKAHQIIENLLQMVQEYRFTTQDKVFKIGASFGLTKISINQTLTLSELFSTVDSACYAAKAAGGNRIHVYSHNDDTVKLRTSQQNWVSRIQQALEKNQFVLYAQTIQSLSGNHEEHCELLIRMRDNDGKLYPPVAFLPAAERYRLMPQIDRWVINEAMNIIARKGDAFKTICAINLSGQSFSDERLLEYIITQIKHHGIDASRLCFEITETAVISSIDQARQFIRGLRALGCRFSLDDFGSGMSSFAYLKNLEVDFLKIDGMFVKSMLSNKMDRAMVESINNIGHVMGLKTIAEFAESPEIIKMLSEIGVDYAQGYGVAMPEIFE
jgi:diguanylate cyclase (GGDEF)-like protein/PAS domain S-box-containing protein